MSEIARPEWLERRIEVDENGCWMWTSAIAWNGYGRYRTTRVATDIAHRAVYILLVGPIPDRLDLDHTCHNADETCPGGVECPHRRCVNPAHMEPATRGDNLSRSGRVGVWAREKTECKHGHAFTPENTYTRADRPGRRECRICRAEAGRRHREGVAA